MRICLIVEHPHARMGGAEIQCYLLAKRLATRGHEVHYICYLDPPKKDPELVFHVVKRWKSSRNALITRPISSLVHIRNLFLALDEASCQIYLQTCPKLVTGITALFCEVKGRIFVYRAANVKDADLTFSQEKGWPEISWMRRKIYAYGIRKAKIIVCNSVKIARDFSMLGKKAIVIPNGQPIVPLKRIPDKEGYVLWVARLNRVKRPEILIEVARRLPQYTFIMVGRGRYKLPKLPKNVKFLGFKTGKALRSLYEKAAIFLNTSLIEGFPNTLIEAGMYYTPYVTFYDPDDVVKRYELGFHVKSIGEAVQSIKELMQNPSLRKRMGINIRRYVEKNHNIETTVNLYEKLFKYLLSKI